MVPHGNSNKIKSKLEHISWTIYHAMNGTTNESKTIIICITMDERPWLKMDHGQRKWMQVWMC